jgi:DNA ligase (NAD+)
VNSDKNPSPEQLASQLLHYKRLYYLGTPAIDDTTYDALEDKLRAMDPHHPVLAFVGYPLAKTEGKVVHEPPMLSLAKTYEIKDLQSFLQKGAAVVSEKFDGMALALEFGANGSLERASTRGNGTLGEDVTEAVFRVKSLPKSLVWGRENQIKIEIRGEIYFPIPAFEPFAERFESYRNAVPGTFGRKEVQEAADVLAVLEFCAYDFHLKTGDGKLLDAEETHAVLGFPDGTYWKRLKTLETWGFFTGVAAGTSTLVEKGTAAEDLQNLVTSAFEKKRDHLMDGLVFRYNDDALWETLGNTSHHPRGSLAFKQTGETAETLIEAIEVNVGRSGKITFRARLAPVQLSGAKITYATLHNAEFITQGGYAPGAKVQLKRSGEVIPSIIGLAEPSLVSYSLPEKCPCGFDLTRHGPDLFCYERRKCAHKDQESLVYFVKSLDILGISDRIIEKLRTAGLLETPADLFRLTKDDFLQMEGFAEKSAENAVKAIQEKRRLPLHVFLTALGLKRGGAVKCKEVARKFCTLEAVRGAKASELSEEKGWAGKSAEDFLTSLQEKSDVIDDLLKVVDILPEEKQGFSEAMKGHPYFGKSICITGSLSRPREEYKARLEKQGAKLVSSVTSKTHLLVCNEASQSSKYTQAVELGVPIVSEAEFEKVLGEI